MNVFLRLMYQLQKVTVLLYYLGCKLFSTLQEERKRIEERRKRREENEKKSQVVQVVCHGVFSNIIINNINHRFQDY